VRPPASITITIERPIRKIAEAVDFLIEPARKSEKGGQLKDLPAAGIGNRNLTLPPMLRLHLFVLIAFVPQLLLAESDTERQLNQLQRDHAKAAVAALAPVNARYGERVK
jgi:hypothetical protein